MPRAGAREQDTPFALRTADRHDWVIDLDGREFLLGELSKQEMSLVVATLARFSNARVVVHMGRLRHEEFVSTSRVAYTIETPATADIDPDPPAKLIPAPH